MIKTNLANDFTDHCSDDDLIKESYRRRSKPVFGRRETGQPLALKREASRPFPGVSESKFP